MNRASRKRKWIIGGVVALVAAGIALVFAIESSEVPFLVRLRGQVTLANLSTGEIRRDEYSWFRVTNTESRQSHTAEEARRLAISRGKDEWVLVFSYPAVPPIYRKHADHLAYDAIWSLYYALESFPKDQRDSSQYHLFLVRGLKLLELREYAQLNRVGMLRQEALIAAQEQPRPPGGAVDPAAEFAQEFRETRGSSYEGYSAEVRTRVDALVAAGRLSEARAFIAECHQRGGFAPLLFVVSGVIDVRECKWDDARSAFRKAYAMEPRILEADGHELIALEWGMGQHEKAMEMISAALEKDLKSPHTMHEALYRDLALLSGKPRPQLNFEDLTLAQFSLREFVGMPEGDDAKRLDYAKRLLTYLGTERSWLRQLARYRVLFVGSELPAGLRADLIRHLDTIELPGEDNTKQWLRERLQKKAQ